MKKPTTKARLSNNEALMQYVEQIITKMRAAESTFPNPVPELDSVVEALEAFRQSDVDAAHRDSRAIRIRRDKRKELEYLVSELSKYVDTIAKGDDTIILASGFALNKDRASFSGLVPKPTKLMAEPQQVGSQRIKLQVNRWKGARMYGYQFRLKDSNDDWSTQLSSKSTCIVEDLARFQEYEFRATYVGINPQPNYSDVVSSFVV